MTIRSKKKQYLNRHPGILFWNSSNIARDAQRGGLTSGGRESGNIESCDFKLTSQNVRGLASNENKRKTVFEQLKTQW